MMDLSIILADYELATHNLQEESIHKDPDEMTENRVEQRRLIQNKKAFTVLHVLREMELITLEYILRDDL